MTLKLFSENPEDRQRRVHVYTENVDQKSPSREILNYSVFLTVNDKDEMQIITLQTIIVQIYFCVFLRRFFLDVFLPFYSFILVLLDSKEPQ